MHSLLLTFAMLSGCFQPLPEVAEPCETWPEPGMFAFDVTVQDKKRRAYVHVPASKGPRDLVFVLHGGAQSREDIAKSTRFIPLGKQEGFVTVFPLGKGTLASTWDFSDGEKLDDVKFLDAVVDELSPRVCGARVLSAGFSQGGMMSHRWGCESDKVDAILPSGGAIAVDGCTSGRPVPIRHYHGVADTEAPYDGRSGLRGTFRSVDESMDIWRKRNGCSEEFEVFVDQGDTTCQAWECKVPTELCSLDGWGHRWPGGANRNSNQHDATVEGYKFFAATAPEDATSTTTDEVTGSSEK